MQRPLTLAHWEHALVGWAHEALATHAPTAVDERLGRLEASARLGPAYAYCAALTRGASRTFYLASALLPGSQRQAARALYAFCRVTDDLVDQARSPHIPAEVGQGGLAAWRRRALAPHSPADETPEPTDPDAHADPVTLAWTHTRLAYGIPRRYAEQLIDGVSRDQHATRYASFADLAAYCYGVASTVGLMAMHIIGFAGPEAVPYAVRLGVALQLTNVLRDVGEDWRAGRVYLPQDELAAYGVTEEDLAEGRLSPAWRELMRFQIARNRQLYAEAMPGIRLLAPGGRLAIQAAAELYQGILGAIEANNYDVFTRRAHLSGRGKLGRLPGIWWRAVRLGA
jgi:phytoene synthase